MVFSSLVFLCIFLPVLFVLYLLIKPIPARNVLLVAASLIFYAYGEPVYILLMVGSIIMNFLLGYKIDTSKRRKAWLAAAVTANLLLLGVFKYTGWLVGMFSDAFCLNIPALDIRLPIGISFYTFQAMSYLIDVYRKDVERQKKLMNFFLYISFFPQLIAGPIVKYHDIEKQIMNRTIDPEQCALGLRRFICGLSKKVLLANVLAKTADAVFALSGSELNALSAWVGAAAYMLQIFFDFSGYSDMAIGMGRMFGFRFQENFNYPYKADTMKEFWRRWHISLSTWFKEYLYIPLGGNRKGKFRTCLNKIIVFFCTGLWHGANLTFVIWGLLHGAFLLFEEVVPVKKLPYVIKRIYVLLVVCVAFVIFRADDLASAGNVIGNMFAGFNFTSANMLPAAAQLTPQFIVILAASVFFALPFFETGIKKIGRISGGKLRPVSYLCCILLLLLCLLSLAGGAYNPFIYFRF